MTRHTQTQRSVPTLMHRYTNTQHLPNMDTHRNKCSTHTHTPLYILYTPRSRHKHPQRSNPRPWTWFPLRWGGEKKTTQGPATAGKPTSPDQLLLPTLHPRWQTENGVCEERKPLPGVGSPRPPCVSRSLISTKESGCLGPSRLRPTEAAPPSHTEHEEAPSMQLTPRLHKTIDAQAEFIF